MICITSDVMMLLATNDYFRATDFRDSTFYLNIEFTV